MITSYGYVDEQAVKQWTYANRVARAACRREHGGPPLSQTARIRIWASEHGIPCAPRGPIPRPVRDAWEAAQ